jgi:hypothetical protein
MRLPYLGTNGSSWKINMNGQSSYPFYLERDTTYSVSHKAWQNNCSTHCSTTTATRTHQHECNFSAIPANTRFVIVGKSQLAIVGAVSNK